MTQGIYKLVNNKNNKVYIGQSIDIENRFKDHIYGLKTKNHHAFKLQDFYNKYSKQKSFELTYEVLEIVENKKHLNSREQKYIKMYDSCNNGFNSVGMDGNETQTKKKAQQNKKLDKINRDKDKFSNYIQNYRDSIIQIRNDYNNTFLYRVNKAIEYFLKNFNPNLYVVTIYQCRGDIDLSVDGIYTPYHARYTYSTQHKCIMMDVERQKYEYKYNLKKEYTPRMYKLDNLDKSKRRYIWFMKQYIGLDESVLQYNTNKYVKNKFSIPFKVIKDLIGYNGSKFREHIIYDHTISELSRDWGIVYPNGKAEYSIPTK